MIQKFRAIGEQLKVARAGNYFPWETASNVVRILVGREPEVYVHNHGTNSYIDSVDGREISDTIGFRSRIRRNVLEALTCK